MDKLYKYTTETFSVNLLADDYIKNFRDIEKFKSCCQQCPNYARTWLCPPFNFDVDEILSSYKSVLLMVTKITPQKKNIPFSESGKLIVPERKRLQKQLLELEKYHKGYSFAYTGTCLYCPEGTCTRPKGQICRYPELMRPSLEACGFDIGRTTSELFNTDLKWGKNGFLPEYLLLVCGLFYNEDLDKSCP